MEYQELVNLKKHHPAWRLLQADYAPLIISFLHRVFIVPNERTISQSEVESKLEDLLFDLRETLGERSFPKRAIDYLNDWTNPEKGWLRKFYPENSDEPHFDLTPATEKAILWLENLQKRQFVGTESRLMTVIELLRQIAIGSEQDSETLREDLEKQKALIEQKIERLNAGELELLDDTSLKDRFQQMSSVARSLLGDFREVEHNFRDLDRRVREQIATWEGHKGELLEKIFGDRDAIVDSDQGRTFRAFMEFVMSADMQQEFTDLLEKVLALDAVKELRPDRRLKKIHFDWLDAGEATQKTVGRLSQQLRRFLDDRAFLENRRIMKIFQQIEVMALKIRDDIPKQKDFFAIDESGIKIQLPMEKPLYKAPVKPVIDSKISVGDGKNIDATVLFEQVFVDRNQLKTQVRMLLQNSTQVSLKQVVDKFPLQKGLSELIAYLAIAGGDKKAVFDDSHHDRFEWSEVDESGETITRSAVVERIIFSG